MRSKKILSRPLSTLPVGTTSCVLDDGGAGDPHPGADGAADGEHHGAAIHHRRRRRQGEIGAERRRRPEIRRRRLRGLGKQILGGEQGEGIGERRLARRRGVETGDAVLRDDREALRYGAPRWRFSAMPAWGEGRGVN